MISTTLRTRSRFLRAWMPTASSRCSDGTWPSPGQAISRAQAQERMFAKLGNPRFLPDVRPLLPAARAETLTEESAAEAFRRVFMTLVDRFPGEPWGRTAAMKQKFGISW